MRKITCIGDAYKQPLADLIVNVHQRQPKWAYIEKDYAIPVILLSVAMFESYMTRAAFLALPVDQRSHIPATLEERAASTCFKVIWDAWGYIETREPHHVVSRIGEFDVRIKPDCFPQFEGRNSVCLAELFAIPLATASRKAR